MEKDLYKTMIKLTSIQAPNQDFIIAGMSDYLSVQLGMETSFVHEMPWQEREQLVDDGKIQIGWICGLPYVRKAAQHPQQFELLAAPVMQAARYQLQPIYFSDVIVHQSSRFSNFADLRGSVWAYNESHSHSGCSLTRYRLSTLGEDETYFDEVVEAGSHQTALEFVLQGRIDATAVDSTVLEQELIDHPQISEQIRIVATLGPSPIPPLVIAREMPTDLRKAIRTRLLEMHTNPAGLAILDDARIARFAAVTDNDYDPIRKMARQGSHVNLQQTRSRD